MRADIRGATARIAVGKLGQGGAGACRDNKKKKTDREVPTTMNPLTVIKYQRRSSLLENLEFPISRSFRYWYAVEELWLTRCPPPF